MAKASACARVRDISIRAKADRFTVEAPLHAARWCAPMKISDDSPPVVSALDRPNSYICQFPPDVPIKASFPCIPGRSVYPGRCLSVSPEGRYERRFPLHEVPAPDLVSGLYDP